MCKCNSGYSVFNGACLSSCSDAQYRTSLGGCALCGTGTVASGGLTNVKENNTCVNVTVEDTTDSTGTGD